MIQQTVAILVILFMLTRVFYQRKAGKISRNESWLWLIFWILAALAVVFIKEIDQILHDAGFSSSGIQFLIYLSVIVLFGFIFRLRLRVAKVEREITELVRKIALKDQDQV